MHARARAILRLSIMPAVTLGAIALAWHYGYFDLDEKERLVTPIHVLRNAWWGMPFYLAAYVGVVLLGLPATVLNVLSGALFGAVRGAALAWTGAMLGTVIAHVVARSIGRGAVKKLFGNHGLLNKLKKNSDVWTLLRLRVLPVAPFGVLDYVAGLAGVPLRPLLIATAIGVTPVVCAYAYVGQTLGRALETGYDGSDRALWIAGAVTACMAVVSIGPTVVHWARTRK